MAKPNYNKNTGRLATDRYQFGAHVDGYSDRHNAADIDVDPPVSVGGVDQLTVGSALSAFSNTIAGVLSSVQTYIICGDGYDTYHNALTTPDTPYDAAVPSLNLALDDLFTNTGNANYPRLYDGAVIVIKSGTYTISDTVEVPAGITITGEGFGTKIINLTLTERPLFKIKADTTRQVSGLSDHSVDGGVAATTKFMFSKETKISNLLIADNFVVPAYLGDLDYKKSKNNVSEPLVSVEEGAHFTAENVKFVGKVSGGITAFAINTDSTTPVTTGTILNVRNCFMDGFSEPISFGSLGGTNDYINFYNNDIRFFGQLNNDTSLPQNNCALNLSVCNININNNYIYGDASTCDTFLYLSNVFAGSVSLQSKSKIIVEDNTFALNKSSNSVVNPTVIKGSATVLANTSKFTIEYKNLFNKFEISIDNFANSNVYSPQLEITGTDFNILSNVVDIHSDTTRIHSANSMQIDTIENDGTITINAGAGDVLIETTGIMNISGSNIEIDAPNSFLLNSDDVAITSTGSISSTATGADINLTSININAVGLLNTVKNSITLTILDTTKTLIASEYNPQTIELIGTIASNVNIVLPSVSGYSKIIKNSVATSKNNYEITVKTSAGTGIKIPYGSSQWIYCDGTNINSGTFQQRNVSTDSNLAFYYKLNESSGNAIDSGPVNIPLLLNGSPTYAAPGPFGNSINFFTASDGFLSDDINSGLPIATTNVSMSCWFSPSKANASASRYIFTLVQDGDDNPVLGITLSSSDSVQARVNGDFGTTIASTGTFYVPTFGNWYHYAATYDGSAVRLYINGNLVAGPSAAVGVLQGSATMFIQVGNNQVLNSPALGYIADCRIENVLRSAEYYKDVYNRMRLFSA